MTYKSEVEKFRAEKDHFFAESHQSPIPHNQRHSFTGLNYYPVDENYRFEIPLIPLQSPEEVEIGTSTGDGRIYEKIGYFEFKVEDQPAKLYLYQSPEGHFYLPFRDKTSGDETYGAGRYIEVEEHHGKYELDFNLAYNPFCVFNENYSCPFTPPENWLDVPIKAGEKNFNYD